MPALNGLTGLLKKGLGLAGNDSAAAAGVLGAMLIIAAFVVVTVFRYVVGHIGKEFKPYPFAETDIKKYTLDGDEPPAYGKKRI